MHVWNTGGLERFRTVPAQLLRRMHGAVLLYDVAAVGTLDGCRSWVGRLPLSRAPQ